MNLWGNLSVFRLSCSSLLKVAGLKFKFNSQCTSEIDFIIIIKVLTQLINIFSKFWQKKRNNLIYAENVHTILTFNFFH